MPAKCSQASELLFTINDDGVHVDLSAVLLWCHHTSFCICTFPVYPILKTNFYHTRSLCSPSSRHEPIHFSGFYDTLKSVLCPQKLWLWGQAEKMIRSVVFGNIFFHPIQFLKVLHLPNISISCCCSGLLNKMQQMFQMLNFEANLVAVFKTNLGKKF